MKTILIVEDEFAIADMLASVLEDEGYRVLRATNGKEGLARLSEMRPDLVLCDIMMPVLDGRSMVQVMKNDPKLANVPVILMSAAGEPRSKSGVEDLEFIGKPFELDVLLRLIDRCIGKPAE